MLGKLPKLLLLTLSLIGGLYGAESVSSADSAFNHVTKANASDAAFTEYDGGIFDYGYYMRNGFEIPLYNSISEIADSITTTEASNSKAMALNKQFIDSEAIYTNHSDCIDLLPLINYENGTELLNASNSTNFYYIDLTASGEESPTYMQFYLDNYAPYYFFDTSYSDDITFYTSIDINEGLIEKINNKVIQKTEIPLIIVNETVYASLVFNGANKGFKILSYQGTSFEFIRVNPTNVWPESGSGPFSLVKITIPHVDKITRLNLPTIRQATNTTSFSDNNFSQEKRAFYFDNSLHGKYYIYRFGLESFNIADSYFVIDHDAMVPILGESGNAGGIDVTYIKIEYIETTKTYVTDSDGKQTVRTESLDSQIIEIEIDPSIGRVDGLVKYCYFDDWERSSDPTLSGSIKVLEIGWDLTSGGDNATTYYHDYSNVDMYFFSFDSSKSIRVYTYKWAGYKRSYYTNNRSFWDYLFAGPVQYFLDDRYLYQCYGFNFYFDKHKTQPIPGVQKIALKWQCGYEVPNTAEGSNGWYPETNDKAKNVNIATKEVDANKRLLNYALDSDGMFISSDTDEALMTDPDGIKYDYVVCKKFTKGNLDTYITQMAPLEIYYQSDELDVIKLSGNSNGYHVVTDDDGVDRVYDANGELVDFLGVYTAPDGTKLPASDSNGDGNFTADETVDTDTGEGRQYFDDPLAEKSAIDKILDFFTNLANSIKNFNWTRLISFIVIFVIIVAFGPAIFNLFTAIFTSSNTKKKRKRKK